MVGDCTLALSRKIKDELASEKVQECKSWPVSDSDTAIANLPQRHCASSRLLCKRC
jgi:hypothetical protein